MHIHSPATDNCPAWNSSSEKIALKMISWLMSMKECFAGLEDRTRNRRLNTKQTGIRPSNLAWQGSLGSSLIIFPRLDFCIFFVKNDSLQT